MSETILITIPFSHFCEKSRWMLDLTGIPYREDGHLPVLHRRATRRFGGSSVPLLATEGQVLKDSSDIAAWVDSHHRIIPTSPDQRADALALEDGFDTVLGPHLRRVMYFHLLKSKPALLAMLATCPKSQARLARFIMPVFKRFLRWSMKLTSDGTERSLAKVRATFDAVSSRLADARPYLGGDTLTVADLTFAALASPILMPPEHPIAWPDDAVLPPAVIALRAELRQTPAGAFCMRLYRDHRRTSAASPGVGA